MRKSQVLLAVLLLFLGLILCAFSMVVAAAIFQVVRSIGQTWILLPTGGAVETHAVVAILAAWSPR